MLGADEVEVAKRTDGVPNPTDRPCDLVNA